jgi:nitrogen regulatory protein PII
MKYIVATIKANMLEDVVFALHKLEGFTDATISDAKSVGKSPVDSGSADKPARLRSGAALVRLETVCEDAVAQAIVDTIKTSAHTGLLDDGRILVMPADQTTDICTGGCCS